MIKIITDSTADLPEVLRRQYDIEAVPLYVVWGDMQYRDRVNITTQEFFSKLPLDPAHPTTSQPSPEDFAAAFKKAKEEGYDEIVCLTIAKELSGTYQSASTAAKDSDLKVHLVDSVATTMGLGWQVLAVARTLESGASLAHALQAAQKVRDNLVTLVGLQTIEYIVRGGRLGGAFKWLGSALSLKPLATLDHKLGKISMVKMQRTQSSLMNELIKEFDKRLKSHQNLHLAVCYGGSEAIGKEMAAKVEEVFHPAEIMLVEYGPVLGVHSGPGGFALSGYGE
ncbi:MAG: DegV family protein [Anaerolineaceae bacterium]|nr:DegV family protein [Anaerolineaceae bacterium]